MDSKEPTANMTAHLSAYTQGRQSKDNKRQAIGEHADHERPRKRMKALLEEDDSFSDEQNTASSTGGVPVSDKFQFSSGEDFTINQDFARRFMHNKEREELQRCKSWLTKTLLKPLTNLGSG